MKLAKVALINVTGVVLLLSFAEIAARLITEEDTSSRAIYIKELHRNAYLNYPEDFGEIHESKCTPRKIVTSGASGSEVKYDQPNWSCPGLSVVNGKRVTVNLAKKAVNTIHVYGGSTVWGTGSSDKHTIPSLLQKNLIEAGLHNYKVINHGVTSLVVKQQYHRLLKTPLKAGDVVIFYDGGNDVVQRSIYNRPEGTVIGYNRENRTGLVISNIRHFLSNNSALYKLLAKVKNPELTRSADNQCTATKALANEQKKRKIWDSYFTTLLDAKSHSRANGSKFYHFYQPSLDRKAIINYDKSYLEAILKATNSSRCFIELTSQIAFEFDSIYKSLSPEFNGKSLYGILSGGRSVDNQNYFIDWIHVTPQANAVITKAIFDSINGHLRQKAFSTAAPNLTSKSHGEGQG